ncbi:hypothetical protein [Phenylobacterium sp.]|nr:hypothetical protein [Phenylobacterium sp.]
MDELLQFLMSLRTSPERAVLVEVGFVAVGAFLLGLTLFRLI